MKSALTAWTVALVMMTLGCSSPTMKGATDGSGGGGGMDSASGGAGGSGGSATGGSGGAVSGLGGSGGAVPGTGGATGAVDASRGGGPDASVAVDAPAAVSTDGSASGSGKGPGPGVVPLPGKAGDFICPLNATKEQCCQMLCECVNRICIDSPKAKPGLAGCLPTCMKLSDMLTRCHVYHCYESVSPSGMGDHDSHCGHAANQVNGGGCPPGVVP